MSNQPSPPSPQPPSPDLLRAFEDYQKTMRDFLRLQEQVMNQFLGAQPGAPAAPAAPAAPLVTAPAPAAPVAPPPPAVAPAAAAAPAAAPAALDREAVAKLVVGVFSERTGYPPDMLALDVGMESDLGIDSIKRVEILGALLNTLPKAVAEAFQGQIATLTQARTLNDLIDTLAKRLASPPPA